MLYYRKLLLSQHEFHNYCWFTVIKVDIVLRTVLALSITLQVSNFVSMQSILQFVASSGY